MVHVVDPLASSGVESDCSDDRLAVWRNESLAEFEKGVQAKNKLFGRYLETRCNWLRNELRSDADATNSLKMSHLEYLRNFKPQMLPQEGLTPRKSRLMPPPKTPASALKALQITRSATAQFRIHQTAKRTRTLLPSPTPRFTPRITPMRAQTARARAAKALSIFTTDAVVYTKAGTPVENPFSNLNIHLVNEIKRLLDRRNV